MEATNETHENVQQSSEGGDGKGKKDTAYA